MRGRKTQPILRAEFKKIFCSVFGSNESNKICFWNLLTFNLGYFVKNFMAQLTYLTLNFPLNKTISRLNYNKKTRKYKSFSLNENMFVIINFLPKVCFLDLTQFEFSKNDEIKDQRPVLIFDRKLKPTLPLCQRELMQKCNLKCVCWHLSRDIRPNKLEHTLLKVPILSFQSLDSSAQ